jgi:hypothetical protein
LQPEQTVSEMANEVLTRQAKARADRRGGPIEGTMEAVLNTEAGRELRELRDGPHGEEGVQEAQVGAGAGGRSRQAIWDSVKRKFNFAELAFHALRRVRAGHGAHAEQNAGRARVRCPPSPSIA